MDTQDGPVPHSSLLESPTPISTLAVTATYGDITDTSTLRTLPYAKATTPVADRVHTGDKKTGTFEKPNKN